MRKEQTQGPANQAVLLADVKNYGYVKNNDRDSELTSLIPAKIAMVENFTGRALVNQEFDIWYNRDEFFGSVYGYGFAELSSLNVYNIVSAETFDIDGTSTTIDPTTYRLSANKIKFDSKLPDHSTRKMDAVKISVQAGYGADSTEMPEGIKEALYQMIMTSFRYNGNLSEIELHSIPNTVQAQLAPFRSTYKWFR